MNFNEFLFLMNGTHKSYQLIQKCDVPGEKDIKNAIDVLRTGDLILRKIKGIKFYHVGLYDGRLIIEFAAPPNATFFSVSSSSSSPGEKGSVSKRSVKNFIGQNQFYISRIQTDIPQNFSEKVDEAMDYEGVYNALTNNCLHFALRLLEVSSSTIPNSLSKETEEECNMAEGETINLTTRCGRE